MSAESRWKGRCKLLNLSGDIWVLSGKKTSSSLSYFRSNGYLSLCSCSKTPFSIRGNPRRGEMDWYPFNLPNKSIEMGRIDKSNWGIKPKLNHVQHYFWMRLENQCSKFKLEFQFHSFNPWEECIMHYLYYESRPGPSLITQSDVIS